MSTRDRRRGRRPAVASPTRPTAACSSSAVSRVVAQGADPPGHLVPGEGEVVHGLVQQHSLPDATRTRTRGTSFGAPTTVKSGRPTRGRRASRGPRRATRSGTATSTPQAPRQRAPRPPTPRARHVEVQPQPTGKGHLARRRPQAAVGTVVISRQQSVVPQRIHASDQGDAAAPDRRSRARSHRTARAPGPGSSHRPGCAPPPRSISSSRSPAQRPGASGSRVRHRASRRPSPRATPATPPGGPRRPALRPRVRIDSESLPTGTPMPSAGHNSIATAATVS
jgi:hypothetical protein